MKILIVSQYYWPENFRINDLARGLKDRGHEISVLTGLPNYPTGGIFPGYSFCRKLRENHHGIKIFRVPLIPRGIGNNVRLVLNYLSFALCASVLGPIICREKYDLIFVFEPSPITVGIPALVLRKIKSIPVMFWVQDLWPESLSATGAITSKLILTVVDKIVKVIYRGCDEILISSKAYRTHIEKYVGALDKIKYFPQSVEAVYRPVVVSPAAPERSLMTNGFNVVFAGNIGASQDFESILEAAQKTSTNRDIHWIIIGDGRMFEWVKSEVMKRNLADSVHLLGRHSLESMPYFFALSDVMLVTLKRSPIFALTVPGKIQSYLACGRPMIAALDGEGAKIVSESGGGIACPAEDPESLAQAVLKMYHMSKEQREEMGRLGKKYYELNFDRNLLINRLDMWMNSLVKNS